MPRTKAKIEITPVLDDAGKVVSFNLKFTNGDGSVGYPRSASGDYGGGPGYATVRSLANYHATLEDHFRQQPPVAAPPAPTAPLLPVVESMLSKQGFYIGTLESDPTGGQVPMLSLDGKLYSMVKDDELALDRFHPELKVVGPFRAQ